ncbi:MAG: FtsX-like permease family protein, partial [Candidatus Hodarchaeota archaeon]
MKRTRTSSLRQFLSNTLGTRMRQIGFSFRLAKINVTRSEYRSTLLILGIFLTIALETGIVVSVDTLYDDFIFNNRNQNYTDISVIPKKWTGLSSLHSIAKDVNSVAGVTKASPVYHLPFDQLLMDEFPNTSILIYGIDPKTHPDFSMLNITDGEPVLSGNNVIISQWLSFDSGLRVGDSIDTSDFNVDLESRTFKISGIMNDPSFFGNNFGYLFILINIKTLFDIVPSTERSNVLRAKIDVSVEDLLNINTISEKIKDTLGLGFYVWAEKAISEIDASGIRAYQTAMNLVILASFVVEFLFITNILAITIRDRSKEIGVLRTVGTDSKQLILAITIEILIYSVIGSIIGMIFGIGFAILLVWRMQYFYPTLKFRTLSLYPSSLIATLTSGIIVSLISGLYPIFIALLMPVVQNIHSRMRSGKPSINFGTYWRYNIIMGGLLALTGLILQLFVGPTRFLDFEILSIHFFVVLLIFLGTILVEIGILFFLPRMAFKFLTPIFGVVTRTISMRNIAR